MLRCSWVYHRAVGAWKEQKLLSWMPSSGCATGTGTRRRLASGGSSSTSGGPGSKLSLALNCQGLTQAGEGSPGGPISPSSSATALASPSPRAQPQPQRSRWGAAHIVVTLASRTPDLIWDSVLIVSNKTINSHQPVPAVTLSAAQQSLLPISLVAATPLFANGLRASRAKAGWSQQHPTFLGYTTGSCSKELHGREDK